MAGLYRAGAASSGMRHGFIRFAVRGGVLNPSRCNDRRVPCCTPAGQTLPARGRSPRAGARSCRAPTRRTCACSRPECADRTARRTGGCRTRFVYISDRSCKLTGNHGSRPDSAALPSDCEESIFMGLPSCHGQYFVPSDVLSQYTRP